MDHYKWTPRGYLYYSTSSMDGGDLFDPTVLMDLPEYSPKISKIFTHVRNVWRSIENSRET